MHSSMGFKSGIFTTILNVRGRRHEEPRELTSSLHIDPSRLQGKIVASSMSEFSLLEVLILC